MGDGEGTYHHQDCSRIPCQGAHHESLAEGVVDEDLLALEGAPHVEVVQTGNEVPSVLKGVQKIVGEGALASQEVDLVALESVVESENVLVLEESEVDGGQEISVVVGAHHEQFQGVLCEGKYIGEAVKSQEIPHGAENFAPQVEVGRNFVAGHEVLQTSAGGLRAEVN